MIEEVNKDDSVDSFESDIEQIFMNAPEDLKLNPKSSTLAS
jgi:hypothetical protein